MKNYQFITVAGLLALIVVATLLHKKKKPCGCGGAPTPETTVETTGE